MARTWWIAMLSIAVLAACTGCTSGHSAEGIVTGRLIAVGGPDLAAAGRPDPGTARPLPGVVKLTAADGKVAAVDVGADGSFRIRAQVGSYRLSGRSPQYGNGRYRCDAVDRSGEYIDKVNVGATRVLSDVVCQMK